MRVRLKEYKTTAYLKKRMMVMSFRMSRQPRGRASRRRKTEDQGVSASKTAPLATEAKEAGEAAAGLGVEAKSWSPPLQSDVEQAAGLMSGAPVTSEGEKLLMTKFNLSRSHTSSGEAPTTGSTAALGPAVVSEEEPEPTESKSRGAPGGTVAGPRYTYQYLSITTNNFEKRLDGGGCGSVFQGVLVSGTLVPVKILELGVVADGTGTVGLSMTDQRWRCCRKCITSTSCRCWDRARTAWRPA